MSSSEIRKDLQAFQATVKKLSDGIGQASSLWSDSKYAELSAAVGVVASQSKEVLVTGDRSCSSIDRFDSVANERY